MFWSFLACIMPIPLFITIEPSSWPLCRWVPKKTIHIPTTAAFQDYSGMAFHGDKFGIISQVTAIFTEVFL